MCQTKGCGAWWVNYDVIIEAQLDYRYLRPSRQSLLAIMTSQWTVSISAYFGWKLIGSARTSLVSAQRFCKPANPLESYRALNPLTSRSIPAKFPLFLWPLSCQNPLHSRNFLCRFPVENTGISRECVNRLFIPTVVETRVHTQQDSSLSPDEKVNY